MGSGSSKTKNSPAPGGRGKQVVVADVVVPNQSQPIRIKGELDQAPPSGSASGQATVKEVGPNKFNLQMGDKNIGTFEASGEGDRGDFSAYLANTASLTIQNIETVAGDGQTSKMASADDGNQMVLKIGDSSAQKKENNEDEMEWEEVIQDVGGGEGGAPQKRSGHGIDLPDGKGGDAGRKAQLKDALKRKHDKLSEQEYEQMIANHRQEVELMNLLREKEKERQKFTLASKRAARKKRRKAKQPSIDEEDSSTADDDLADTQRYQQLQSQIAQQKAVMEDAQRVATGNESEHILEEHKKRMAGLEAELKKEEDKRRRSLQDKLKERQEKRKARQDETEEQKRLAAEAQAKNNKKVDGTKENTAETAMELQRLEAELKQREAQFEEDMKTKRGQLTDEEYRRLMTAHKQELAGLQHRLDVQRDRQQQSLLDKLAARRARRSDKREEMDLIAKLEAQTNQTMKNPEDISKDPTLASAMSADEIKELQMAINKKDLAFRKTFKDIKASKSAAEAQEYMDRHRREMVELQQQLDLEKARMKAVLMAKLEARRRKGGNVADETEPALSPEEVKQLQLILDQRSASFRSRQAAAKKEMAVADYQTLIDDHQRDMDDLERRLELERLRMDQSMKQELAARRFRRQRSKVAQQEPDKPVDVQTLQSEIERKEADFQASVEAKKSKMSSAEYQRLLEEHRQEMDTLTRKLDGAKERQRGHLEDKLEARRRRRKMIANEEEEKNRLLKMLNEKTEQLTEDEFNQIAEDILTYDESVSADIEEKKGQVSQQEHQKMVADHKWNMDSLEKTLITKGQGKDEEVRQLENNMAEKAAIFLATVEDRKSELPREEYERLLRQHEQEMGEMERRLGTAQDRQRMHLEDKLAARRRRRMMVANEEEERRRLLQRLEQADQLTSEELVDLQRDVQVYDEAVMSSIQTKKGQVSQAELDRMVTEHGLNVTQLNGRVTEEMKRVQTRTGAKARVWGGMEVKEDSESDEDDEDVTAELDSEDEIIQYGQLCDLPAIDASIQASYTSTSLWTTPTQSNDVVIVPLKHEYPVKRKRELYSDPAVFREIDAHAIKLAQTVSLVTQPSFSALVNELTDFGTSELQKVRLVFRWLTAQNCEEMDLNDVIDDTPLGVLKGLYHKKITFSTLFMRMCRFIGLRCVEIVGIAKVKGYRAGQFINPKEVEYQHTWNAVCIDGFWHFVDCNWGVSHIAGSMTSDPFRFEYDEHYFLADPDVIIYSHFPNDSSWQLLTIPLTLDGFNNQALLKPDFFKFFFNLISHRFAIIDAPNGELNIQIHAPQGFILSCRLSAAENDRDVSRNGIPFDQYEFIHQISDTAVACYVRIPEAGQFYLTLYTKKQYLDGELNIESSTEICKYFVRCPRPSRDPNPLPDSPADHWGPIGTMNAGLVPVSHTTSVAMSQDGSDFDIRFKRTQPLRFSHTLTSYGMKDQDLVPYALHRNVEDELVFTVTPPRPGRYGLHIFVNYPGLAQPVHLCSYLLVAHAARQNIQAIPSLPNNELWGPSEAFVSFGLTTFTNPDPFIVTLNSVVEIVIGTQSRLFLTHRMLYNGRDMTDAVEPHFGDGSVTFLVNLPYGGYFHLQILGKESQDPSIPAASLFNYLIRRD